MDLSERLYTSVLTFVITLILVGFFCYVFPRLILAADFDLFGLEMKVFFFIGLVPIILGIVAMVGYMWGFMVAGTGTPMQYDMPKELIVRGSYRFVRNPMYVGHCLLLLGQTILFMSFGFLLYLVAFFLLLHLLVVFIEEPMLKQKF